MKSQTRLHKLFNLILLTLLGVLMYVSQVIMASLPNIEIVSLLIIVITCLFGARALISIYIFVLCETLTYGFEMWVINYLYVWLFLWIAVMLTRKFADKTAFTLISAIFGLIFGILCSIPYFITLGIAGGIVNIIKGIGYDITHCIGNLVLTYLLFTPVKDTLEKTINKYIK